MRRRSVTDGRQRLAGEISPSGDERRKVTDLLGEFWSRAVLTAGAAEEEIRRLVERLAEVVELRPEDLQTYTSELAKRLAGQRQDMERSLDEAVRQGLSRLRVPSKSEFAALQLRISALSARLDQLEARLAPPRTHRPRHRETDKV